MESIANFTGTQLASAGRGAIASGGGDVLVDVVDSSDTVLSQGRRDDVTQRGLNFRVVHVLVFNSRSELLVQHIASGLRHAGMWGSSAAGFIRAGDTYEASAARKLTEELASPVRPAMVGKTSMKDGASTKFIGVFEAKSDGPFSVDAASASEVEFLSLPAIAAHRQSGLRLFTPTFLVVLDFYLNLRSSP
jgi:isopentenyldiphosphate isomerase